MYYPSIKALKTVLYAAVLAPIVTDALVEGKVIDIPDDVQLGIRYGSPVVAMGAGIMLGKHQEMLDTMSGIDADHAKLIFNKCHGTTEKYIVIREDGINNFIATVADANN